MSYGRYEREYHLTPSGWTLGTFFVYGKVDDIVPPPADRVLTIVEEGYSPGPINWREHWRSDDSAEIERLCKKFGDRPTHTD